MSTIIKFDLKELRRLANNKNTCVIEKRVIQTLALQPWCLGNLKESVKNLVDYKIGKYDKQFNGILLSYKNLRVLQNVGSIKNDSSDVHFQVQADYFIFKPQVGALLKGVVYKKSVTHLGILVHRVFNVVIPRPTEEPGNKWIGTNIKEGQEVLFRIVVLDLFGALPYIRGEIDERYLGHSHDDEMIATQNIEPVNVSHVNFDKTKPNSQRNSGDGLANITVNKPSKSVVKPNKSAINNNHTEKTLDKKTHDSESSIKEKRVKRQNKYLDAESSIEPTTKASRKNKRDY